MRIVAFTFALLSIMKTTSKAVYGTSFLIPLAFALSIIASQASQQRGVWFWRNASSPYGSDNLVGNATLETETIGFFQAKKIRRVYGSYGTRPVTEPAVIASWNAKLAAAGIQSQLLLSDNTWIFPGADRASLISTITTRLLNFNLGRPTSERFVALHLDIEPQGLATWSTLDPTQKRDHLFYLRDTYAEVRQLFVDNGMATFPIYADLPVWFDNLPIDGGSIGWTDAVERNAWFDAIGDSLTGVSLMPFDRDSFSSINNGVSWERSGTIPGAIVRCGIEADIGTGATWVNVPTFNNMLVTLEDNYGFNGAVDIQSYRLWREAIDNQPILPVEGLLEVRADHVAITFEGIQDWTYIISQSIDLCRWVEIQQVRNVGNEPVIVPFQGDRGFWSVSRFQEVPNGSAAR